MYRRGLNLKNRHVNLAVGVSGNKNSACDREGEEKKLNRRLYTLSMVNSSVHRERGPDTS